MSSAEANEAEGEVPLAFEVPRRWKYADAALSLVLLPFSMAAMALLLLIPATLLRLALKLDGFRLEVIYAVVVALAVLLGLLLVVWRLGWVIRLEKGRAQLGPFGIGPRIPYDEVRLLRVGTLAGSVPRGKVEAKVGTLHIHRSPLRRYELVLDRADAERCFEELRRRCKNAAAVDLLREGAPDYLPASPDAVPSALRRLRRYWFGAGVLFLLIGAVPYVAFWIRGYDFSSLQDATDTLRTLDFLVVAPALLAFGCFALRRALRHHRALKRRR